MKKICFYCGQQYKKSKTKCPACGAAKTKPTRVEHVTARKKPNDFSPVIEHNPVTGRYRIMLRPESKKHIALYISEWGTLSSTYAEFRFMWTARLALARFTRLVQETRAWG